MARFSLYLPLLSVWLLGHFNVAYAGNNLQVATAVDQTVTFSLPAGTTQSTPKSIKTGLFDLNYIGVLHPHDDSTPYFLFSGNPCRDCAQERALYLLRPPLSSEAPKITSFVYPGKILDPKTRVVVLESRAFYGRCLSGVRGDQGDDVYVVFQKENVDRRHRLQTSVFVADASSDFLRERLIERGLPSLKRTTALVKSKNCHEITGRNRIMQLKPRGLDWRNIQPSDADDDKNDENDKDKSDKEDDSD